MPQRTTPRLVALDSVDTQRRAGRVMLGVAAVGVFVALVGGVLGWQFVGRLDSTGGETLEVTVETLDTLSDTIDLADGVLGATVAALDSVGVTLEALDDGAVREQGEQQDDDKTGEPVALPSPFSHRAYRLL